MNRHQKKVLTLAGAIANLSLSCAVAGVATYAWYYERREVSTMGTNISAASDVTIDYDILKYDDDLKKGVAYHNDDEQFFLPDYDQYIKAKNVYSNIVIRAEISFGMYLDTTDHELEIDITKTITSTLKDANGIRLLTSNVSQFKCIATSYTPYNSDTSIPIGVGISEVQGTYKDVIDAEYRTAIAYFATRNTPSTFISLMNGQPVDPDNGDTITLVPELYNIGTIKKAVVYIECSYNEKLVDAFVEDHPNEQIHNLTGDIEQIKFAVRPFLGGVFGAANTGQYIRMNDVGGSYTGQYLTSYIDSSNQRVLDGSLTTGDETVGESSGINVSNNYLGIEDYIKSDKSEVYASNSIDDASFAFNRTNGTYLSDNKYYIGNDSNTNGIVSSSSATNMQNTLGYNGYNAVVKPANHDSMQMQYDSSDSKFAYYGTTKNPVSLYRFHENDIVNATLTGFTVSAPTDPLITFSVGEYFSLRGVSCVATYTKPDNTTFTLNVSTVCTYTTIGEGTLIPDKTIFTSIGDPKTINVSYTDRGVTMNGSFNVKVLADILEYITITSTPTKTTFVKGEPFDLTGLVVTGHFATVGEINVTSDCTFKINDTYYSHNQILNVSGNNLNVVVHYNGGATLGDFYQDKTFTVTIYNYIIDIDTSNETIGVGGNITLNFVYNGNVDWTIDGPSGSLAFSSSDSSVVTSSTAYTGSDFANQSGQITVYGLAAGTSTVTATINGTSISDSVIVRVTDGTETYATYTVTSTTQVVTTGDVPAGSTASYNSTYNTKYQLTANNSMTLTLNGYTGYKITGIVLSMRSNASSGAGNFQAVVGTSTTIASIATAPFNDPSWNGAWSGTNYVNIQPTISVSRTVSNGESVTLTIAATANSLFCQSFTVYYEQGAMASVQSLQIKDNDVVISGGSKTINGGALNYTWTPTAVVTYTDSTTNNSVAWSIVTGTGLTIDPGSGQITITTASGSATIKATTTGMNAQGNHVEATFTLTWSNLARVLTELSVSGQTVNYTVGDTFSFDGTATATYSNGDTANVTSSVTVSTPDMSSAGTKEVTVSYTEGGVTKTATYSIYVSSSGGQTSTYTIVFHSNNNDSGTELSTSDFLSYDTGTNSSVDSNTLVESISATSKCYAGKYGIKFGSSSAAGSFTAVPKTAAASNVVSISITCAQYGSDTGVLRLSVNGSQVGTDITPSNGSYTYTPTTTISTVNNFGVATSSKRAYLTSVTFTVEGGSTPPAPTVTSISIDTAPTKTTYTEGEYFDPTGLVIEVTYSDNSSTTVAYAGHSSDFSFSPSLTTQLTTSDASVTIGYEGQTCSQSITVNANQQQTTYVYQKVTAVGDLVNNGLYLIVYEDGNVAFNGGLTTLDAASNTIAVTITNNTIPSNTTTNAAAFTINTTNGTILSASGYYVGQTSDANGMLTNQNTQYTNTITFNNDGTVNIIGSGGAYLRYNSTSGQTRFRYYKSASYTGQKAITLYVRVAVQS